jgi:hypothetical protein
MVVGFTVAWMAPGIAHANGAPRTFNDGGALNLAKVALYAASRMRCFSEGGTRCFS